MDEIISRTDGVPLFVEEVTKSYLEHGEKGIPMSLQSSLTARLDAIGDAKEVAQVGATIGREFEYAMIERLLVHRDAEVATLIDRLV